MSATVGYVLFATVHGPGRRGSMLQMLGPKYHAVNDETESIDRNQVSDRQFRKTLSCAGAKADLPCDDSVEGTTFLTRNIWDFYPDQ